MFGNPAGYQIKGDLFVKGQKRNFRRPQDAIKAGMAYVTEDRKGNGLILIQDVKENITLANLRAIAHNSVIDENAEIKVSNA
jgi:putative multiple sugar transport system ATP-binding protein